MTKKVKIMKELQTPNLLAQGLKPGEVPSKQRPVQVR